MGGERIKNDKVLKYQDIIALLCLFAGLVLFVLKAPYGLGIEDEGWYLNFPHRLLMGDALIADEWHLAQLIGILLYIPMKVYVSLAGSMDGIILFFRYLFIAFQAIIFVALYARLRKFGIFGIAAALLFFLNIPRFMFMTLGYYSMGLGFAALAGFLAATQKRPGRAAFAAAGLFFAVSVMNNPPLALTYAAYSLCVLVAAKSAKGRRFFSKYSAASFSFQSWAWMTLGICAVSAAVLAFILSRASAADLFKNLPMLFQDPEYRIVSSQSGTQNLISITKLFTQIVKVNPYLFAASVVLYAVVAFDKKRMNRRRLYVALAGLIFLLYAAFISISFEFPNYTCYFFPFALLGLACYIVSEKKNRELFVFCWLFGVLYTVCLEIATEQDFAVSSMGMLISAMASAVFVGETVRELAEQGEAKQANTKKLPALLLTALLAVSVFAQAGQEAVVDISKQFYTEYLALGYDTAGNMIAVIDRQSDKKLDTLITEGPQKGLLTTAERAKIYNCFIEDFHLIKQQGRCNVYVAGLHPWMYLALDMPYATGSTWYLSWSYPTEMQRLADYIELHPDRVPDVIYVPKVQELVYLELPDRTESLLREIDKHFDFVQTQSDCGYTLTIIKQP